MNNQVSNLIEPETRYHGNIKCTLKKKSRRFEEEIIDLQVFRGDSRKKIKIEEFRGAVRTLIRVQSRGKSVEHYQYGISKRLHYCQITDGST